MAVPATKAHFQLDIDHQGTTAISYSPDSKKIPSLRIVLEDTEWIDDIWLDSKTLAEKQTGLDIGIFPEFCPWHLPHVLEESWLSD